MCRGVFCLDALNEPVKESSWQINELWNVLCSVHCFVHTLLEKVTPKICCITEIRYRPLTWPELESSRDSHVFIVSHSMPIGRKVLCRPGANLQMMGNSKS